MVNQVTSLLAFIDHFKDGEQDAQVHFVKSIILLSRLPAYGLYF